MAEFNWSYFISLNLKYQIKWYPRNNYYNIKYESNQFYLEVVKASSSVGMVFAFLACVHCSFAPLDEFCGCSNLYPNYSSKWVQECKLPFQRLAPKWECI